jgi:glycosyltransferase involved in cell wall biosynthesis
LKAAKTTVVVPVWDDYCDLLQGCVASALDQVGVVEKAIVVDNASASPLPPLPLRTEVVRSPERLSVGAARNLGLAAVETPYVTFLDADDVLLPHGLELLRDRLDATPHAVSAIGRYVNWNPSTGERRQLRRAPTPATVAVSRSQRLFALLNLRFNTFPVVGCVHRTAAVRDAGGYGDTNVGEDWILGALLAFRGRILFDERPVFLRRVREGSLWYRRHDAEGLLRRGDLLRSRAGHDAAVPDWVRLLLPVFERLHRRDVRRVVGGESFTRPQPFFVSDGSP